MYPSRHHTLALFLAATYPIAALATAPEAPAAAEASPVAGEAAPAAEGEPSKKVVVTGQRQNYRSLSATGATKTDTPLQDLPQSVRVITGDLLKDVGVTDLAGALDLSSGISRASNFGGLWDSYAMRGFTGDPNFGSDYMVNGFSSSRGYNGLRDGVNTQSVEILKGPAAALYGRGEPGGTVNITTKKPRFQPEYAIEGTLSSYRTRRGAVDFTGPISDTLAYRLNAAWEKGDSFRDGLKHERKFVSPSFVWLVGEATTVSYEVEAVEQKSPFDRGVLAVNGVLGLIPVSRFLGELSDGPVTIRSLGQQVFVQHPFNDDWKLQTGVAYRSSSLYGQSSQANNLLADGRTLRRQHRLNDNKGIDRSGRLELVGKFATGPIVHNVLFGVDAFKFDDRRIQYRRNPNATNPYAIDIYNPVYGGVADPMTLSIDTKSEQRAYGVYAQDQVDLTAQWKMLLGVRRDSAEQEVTNYRVNVTTKQSPDATSPRVGLVYQPSKQLSLYGTAGRAFRPNDGISIENRAFEPEKSKSYELGAKYDNDRLSGTLAVYRITKQNVLTTNPINTDFSLAAGEVASKGLELDVSGELARDLKLSASYAYTDARVTKGDANIVTGSRFPNVPQNSATVVLTKGFALGSGKASLGGAVNYVGARLGDVAASSSFELPAYTVFRLISSYAPTKKTRVSLNIDNLFNKSYYASSYSQVWVTPGATRTVSLNVRHSF
jgi:iron complex outermembrane receptor protein